MEQPTSKLSLPAVHIEKARGEIATLTVASLITAAAIWTFEHGNEGWDVPYPVEAARKHVDNGAVYLISETAKEFRPIGTLDLRWSDERFWGKQPDNAGYLHRLAIHPDMMKQRIGEAALGWVEQVVWNEGREYVRLDCPADNIRLRNYYKKQGYGFQSQVEIRNDAGKITYIAARYQKRLAP